MRVLVIGPSHIAAFIRLIDSGYQLPNVSFDIAGIHGAAFTDNKLVEYDGKFTISLVNTINPENQKFINWFTSSHSLRRPINLNEYEHIIFLDPLFVIGGFIKDVLFFGGTSPLRDQLVGADRKSLCLDFLLKDSRLASLRDFSANLVSHSVWFHIYESWRTGTIKFLDIFRTAEITNRVTLFSPVYPPLRRDLQLYALYNKFEQEYLANRFLSEYGVNSILQPSETIIETQKGIYTSDTYHESPPDPHHPKPDYYRCLLDKWICTI